MFYQSRIIIGLEAGSRWQRCLSVVNLAVFGVSKINPTNQRHHLASLDVLGDKSGHIPALAPNLRQTLINLIFGLGLQAKVQCSYHLPATNFSLGGRTAGRETGS